MRDNVGRGLTHGVAVEDILGRLRSLADPEAVEGMARFGINPEGTLGVSMPAVRGLARDIGRDHGLAQALWKTGVHEARILAGLIDEPGLVTEGQMECWASGFDSWDVCDQVCMNLFDRTPFAYEKALEWSRREEEFVKRAGFALMASLAVHDKKASDERFLPFLAAIVKGSGDDRNFVKKAVNWALRQIGKRSLALHGPAVRTAREIAACGTKSGRWIAADALRELQSAGVESRLRDRVRRAAGRAGARL
jgi:3-methyladenine DNA glycosylase AlkD